MTQQAINDFKDKQIEYRVCKKRVDELGDILMKCLGNEGICDHILADGTIAIKCSWAFGVCEICGYIQ